MTKLVSFMICAGFFGSIILMVILYYLEKLGSEMKKHEILQAYKVILFYKTPRMEDFRPVPLDFEKYSGKSRGKKKRFGKLYRLTIGSDEDADIRIDDYTIAGKQLQIICKFRRFGKKIKNKSVKSVHGRPLYILKNKEITNTLYYRVPKQDWHHLHNWIPGNGKNPYIEVRKFTLPYLECSFTIGNVDMRFEYQDEEEELLMQTRSIQIQEYEGDNRLKNAVSVLDEEDRMEYERMIREAKVTAHIS